MTGGYGSSRGTVFGEVRIALVEAPGLALPLCLFGKSVKHRARIPLNGPTDRMFARLPWDCRSSCRSVLATFWHSSILRAFWTSCSESFGSAELRAAECEVLGLAIDASGRPPISEDERANSLVSGS